MTRRKGYTMERKKKAPRHQGPQLKAVIRRQPTVFAVYTVLRLIVLATLVSSIIRGEYESAFICLLVLGLFVLPFFIQQNFGIELPSTLEIIILLFIFASEILGELKCYFITYPHWDSMLHTTTGFLCAATGFALIDILNRNSKIKFQLSPIYVAVAAFCFSMTVVVLWEFFEFGMDRLFMMDMQKDTVVNAITSVMLDPTNSNIPVTIDGITSVTINGQELGLGGYLDIGLYDTMGDLFVNFIGAAVFSTIGYFYIKQRGKGKLAKAFMPTITEEEREAELLAQAEKRRAAQRSRTGFDPIPADFCPRLTDRQIAVLTKHINRIGIFKRDTTEEEIARLLACQLAEPLQTTHNKLLALLLESLSASRLITPKWQRVAGNNGCFTSKLGKPLTAKDLSAAKQMAEIIDRRKERMIIDCIEALEAAE